MQKGDRIRVLCINNDSNPYSGVVVFLMNVFHHIDHKILQLDFLTPGESSYYTYKKDIRQGGGKIYAFHIDVDSTRGKLKFGRQLHAFLKVHSYDIIHINSGSVLFDCISALAAKFGEIKVIVHSHNVAIRSWWGDFMISIIKILMQKEADVLCACSEAAAISTFTSGRVNKGDVKIIKNGIDLPKYQYNEGKRNKIRKLLNIEGRLVVGHVGRFAEQKNHEFLIDIFTEILKKEPSAILLLVGQGDLESVVRTKVQKLHLENNVIFLGARDDVEDVYQAMDLFLFPSLFEGLPISLIEAQASGLPCVISDVISKEVDVTLLIHRVSLQDSAQQWADKALSIVMDNDNRVYYKQKLEEAGYGIENTAVQISQIYEELMFK